MRLCAAVLLLAASSSSTFAQAPSVVTVTNATNNVNGDTSSIAALNTTPGPDGISFREAILASNGTEGEKLLTFSTGLVGVPIAIGSPNAVVLQIFILGSGELTIDGDLNDDHTPDIILESSQSANGTPFTIRSPNNTIGGLVFSGFRGPAIYFACLDRTCAPRAIGGTKILDNRFDSARGGGITISAVGLLTSADTSYLGDAGFEDITIDGNTFLVREAAIAIKPGFMGTSRNFARNITISRNRITAPVGIDASAADMSSPPLFSENNDLENLFITDNVFTDCGIAINVFAANYGNTDNRVKNVQITSNTFADSTITGIAIAAAVNGRQQRNTGQNVVQNLLIEKNQMTGSPVAIMLSAADLPMAESDALSLDENRVEGVTIRSNAIRDYTSAGIRIWGAIANQRSGVVSASRNLLKELSITDNTISTTAASATTGIEIIGGEARGGSVARDNVVKPVRIRGNRISGNAVGISIIGGRGPGARGNQVFLVQMDGNTLAGNAAPVSMVSDVAGATANFSGGIRRRAVRR